MKKIFLTLGLLVAPTVFAQFNTMDPRMQQGAMQGPLSVGEMPTNMANGQVCPPQIAPMQAPLNQGLMPAVQQQYNQGIHNQQFFQGQQQRFQ